MIKKTYLFLSIFLTFILISTSAEVKRMELKSLNSKKIIPVSLNGKVQNYYPISSKIPLIINFKGPGIIRVQTRNVFKAVDESSMNYSIIFSLDGSADITRKMSSAGPSKKSIFKNKYSGIPGTVISFSVKAGIGHHTLKIRLGSSDKKILARFLYTKRNEKNREWISIYPVTSNEPVNIVVRENVVKYFRFSKSRTMKVRIKGPVKLKFLSRIEGEEDTKKSINYMIIIRKSGKKLHSYELESTRSILAEYKKGGNKLHLYKSRNVVVNVPSGNHLYEVIPYNNKLDSFLGRFIFSKEKSKKQLNRFGNKKKIISGDFIQHKSSNKDKWGQIRPAVPLRRVTLLEGKRSYYYYRVTNDKRILLNVTGPTKLKILSRVENKYNMRGRINYRIQIKNRGNILNTYRFSVSPSETVVYKNERKLIPGKLREIIINVPRGKQKYQIYHLDKDKSLLFRILSPVKKSKKIVKTASKQSKKWISVNPSHNKSSAKIKINKRKYKYFYSSSDKPIRIKIREPGDLKMLVRKAVKFKKNKKINIDFVIKRNGRIYKKFSFKRKASSSNTFIKNPGDVSNAGVVVISNAKKDQLFELKPLDKNSGPVLVRLFVNKNISQIKVEPDMISEKTIRLITKEQSSSTLLKAANTKKLISRSSRKKVKSKKWRFRFSIESVYDSNILRYSPKYEDRFINPLNKDDGRFRINDLDDVVIYTTLNLSRSFSLLKGKRSEIGARFSYAGYNSNRIKNWINAGISLNQRLSKRSSFKLLYSYIPDFYIRHYRDKDLVDNIGYDPETFQPMDFSAGKFSFRFEQKTLKDMKIHLSFNYLTYKYDELFTEYDSQDTIFGLRVYKNLSKKIRVNTGVRFRKSNAKGFDEPGEDKLNSDELDASYTQTDYLFGFNWRIPQFFDIKNKIYLGFHYYRRRYSSTDPVSIDPIHSGRYDNYFRLFLTYTVKVTNFLDISAFYNRNIRKSHTVEVNNIFSISEEKNYSQNRLGLRLTYLLKK